MKDLQSLSTVEKRELLAKMLRERNQTTPTAAVLHPFARDRPPRASFAQERMWIAEQLAPGSGRTQTSYRMRGPLDVTALQSALAEITRRHEILRTTYRRADEVLVQDVHPFDGVELPLEDLTSLPASEREEAAEARRLLERRATLDLAKGPVWRARLFKLDADDHLFSITWHHIVMDAWSSGIFLRELTTLYEAFRKGDASPLEPLPVQYVDYAEWQRQWVNGDGLAAHRDYWERQLAGAPPVIDLPLDRPRRPNQGHENVVRPFEIPAAIGDRFKAFCRTERVSLFTGLVSIFQLLLSRYSGQSDVRTATPIAQRTLKNTEPLIGYFLNSVIIRTQVRPDAPFRELLTQVRQTLLDAFSHQEFPFEEQLRLLQGGREAGGPPLMQTAFVLHTPGDAAAGFSDLQLQELEGSLGGGDVELQMYVEDKGDGLALQCAVGGNGELFHADWFDRFRDHYLALLARLVDAPDARVGEVPVWSDAERDTVLIEWNRTEAAFPQDACVQELFEAQAQRSPDATAVIFESQQLTYRELDRRSNQLANFLKGRGVRAGDRVGVALSPSLETIVGLYGILKAGAAYVPVDPSQPTDRLAFIFRDAGVQVVLTQAAHVGSLPSSGISTICLDADAAAVARASDEKPAHGASADHLAYILYTSGSTGEAKGVLVPHRAVVNHNTAVAAKFGLKPGDRMVQFTPINFDAAGEEIYPPLLSGATCVVRSEMVPQALEFKQLIEREQLSVLSLPPAYLHEWVCELARLGERLPASLRLVVLGGEKLLPQTLEVWQRIGGRHIPWFNVYGPTEATVTSTTCEIVGDEELLNVPILPMGRPIANAQIYLLDPAGRPVLRGHPGEIHIAGAGLAIGYLNRPDLTAEKFVPNPFSSMPGARMYRTGDLARYLPDGRLEFLGRIDHQVKIRGFRVELGEVESTLRSHPAIQEALVLPVEHGTGDLRLVGYYVKAGPPPDAAELRAFVQQKLPEYMVPAAFVALDAFPLTPNGKVDRKALPPPDSTSSARGPDVVGPRTTLEGQLALLWEEALSIRPIGVTDHFFELGGHSLLAIQLLSQMHEKLGVQVQMHTFFENPTIEHVAATLMEENGVPPQASPVTPLQPEGQSAPLFMVHGMFGDVQSFYQLAARMAPEHPVYALRAPEMYSEQEFTTVEARAAHYVEAIRTQQPQGPYYIAGWSSGAVFAYEIAQQLRAQGQDVAALIICDTGWSICGDHYSAQTALDDAALLGWGWLGRKEDELLALPAEERWTSVLDGLKAEGSIPPYFGIEDVRPKARVVRGSLQALGAYRAKPFEGRLVVLASRDGHYLTDSKGDQSLGWRSLCTGPLETMIVGGEHNSMFTLPHAEGLAEQLKSLMR